MILASLRLKRDFRFERSAEEMHAQLVQEDHYLHPHDAKQVMQTEHAEYVFVDIRDPNAFADYHLPGAVNIPMQTVLGGENLRFFQEPGTKVLVDDNSIDSNQIWLLLSQYGIEDLLVLEGGLDYWKLHVKQGMEAPGKDQYNDEKPKFDYDELVRDGAVENAGSQGSADAMPLLPVQRGARKSVQGGCS
jgi:rhodanese-related sulfurtransferase